MGLRGSAPRCLAGVVAVLAAGGAGAQDDARVLLREGDAVAGARIERIRTHDVDVAGRWAAVVELEGQGSAVLLDGALVGAPGVALPWGDVPVGAHWIDVEDGGHWLMAYTTATHPTGRLAIDGQVALSAGDPADGFGLAAGAVLTHVRVGVLEPPHVLVSAQVWEPGLGRSEAALLYGLGGAAALTPMAVLVRSGRPASAPGIVEDILATPAVSPAGDTLVSYSFNGALGTDLPAGDFNGAGAFVTGTPGPAPGTTWAVITPRIALSRASGYLVCGTVASPWSSALGVVAREDPAIGSIVLALEGQPFAARPADTVADFHSTDVDLADDGTPLFAVPLTSGRTVLTDGDAVLLETGVSVAGGEVVTELFLDATLQAPGRPDTVHITSDARIATVVARLSSGAVALLELERRIGSHEPCAAVPNSTGQVARLDAAGSSAVSANQLVLRGSALPPRTFAAPLAGRAAGFVPALGGGQGTLCVGGAVGLAHGATRPTDAAGASSHPLDLTRMPQGLGIVGATAGETWRFQLWHRDVVAGVPTSNLSEALAVHLR